MLIKQENFFENSQLLLEDKTMLSFWNAMWNSLIVKIFRESLC